MSIDEAQILLAKCEDKFSGPIMSHLPRSLLTKLISTWSLCPQISLIVSGTSFQLQHCLNPVTSAVHKAEADTNANVIVNFGGYYDCSAMGAYIRSFFPINDNELDTVFELLRGLTK